MLNKLRDECFQNSLTHGFKDEDLALIRVLEEHSTDMLAMHAFRAQVSQRFQLIVDEVSEAHEEVRSGHKLQEVYEKPDKPGKPEGVPIELADVIIRVLDFCGEHAIDIQGAVERKMKYNASRPYKHGRKF